MKIVPSLIIKNKKKTQTKKKIIIYLNWSFPVFLKLIQDVLEV